ncbi:MAG: Lrp/AsnC family transcriptional regulator [Rhizomicrobium sp.]
MEAGKPDKIDLKIIRELREDGRRPTKEIAESLSLAEPTIASRIRALNEAGVMRVMAQVNVKRLRNRQTCFMHVWVRGREIDEVAKDLAKFDRITTVQVCVGSPEIHLMAFVEENTAILALLQNEVGLVEGVDRLEVNLALKTIMFRSDYAALDLGPTGVSEVGDKLDDQIVRQLQIDGRVSNREIARTLDVPASTVRERVNRMLHGRVIRIGAVCDPGKLGLNMAAFGYLQVAAASLERALSHLGKIDDLGIVCTVSGRHSIFVLAGARDFAHFVAIVKSRLETTPGLTEITIRNIAEVKKHRADLIYIVDE